MSNHPIIVIEGPDGAGKSILATELAVYLNAHYIHLSYRWKTKMFDYHTAALFQALLWSKERPVVIDRFWPSELIYAEIYRGGSPWPMMGRLLEKPALKHAIVYVLCIPEDREAYLNHYNELKDKRVEMFDYNMDRVYHNYILMWQNYFSKRFGTQRYDFIKQGDHLKEVMQNIIEITYDYRTFQWPHALDFEFMNFTGNTAQAKYLLVGDQLKPKTRREVWPWFEHGNSSKWLAEALEYAKVPEYEIIAMNATLPYSAEPEYRIRSLLDSDYGEKLKVISLGNTVEKLLYKSKIPIYKHLHHPQYYRRFARNKGMEIIKEVFDDMRLKDD